MCGDASYEYYDCRGDVILQYGAAVCIIFDWTVRVTPVWWWHKVKFLEVAVEMGPKTLELTQCLR